VPSRNLETYLRLIGQANFGQDGARDYLRDDRTDSAVMEAYAPDVEIHEPPSLPQGGVHVGREAWRKMHEGIRGQWDQGLEIHHIWDLPDEDVIVLYSTMDWTAKATGRHVQCPFVSVLRFRDGLIAKVEIFHHDSKAILDTLAPVSQEPEKR
jgi:ketosteroid isomerase-like protein